MATTITPSTMTLNAATTITFSAGQAMSGASGTYEIAYPKEGKLVILINSTYAGANSVEISAGEFLGKGVGAITVTTAQNGMYAIVVSSERCKDFSGNITIDEGTNTGYIRAIYIPNLD